MLREKLGVGGSFPIVWHYVGNGVYDKSVSQPFLLISVWVFSHSTDMCAFQLLSGFPSGGIIPCVAVHSVCLWEEESSGATFKDCPSPNFIKSKS